MKKWQFAYIALFFVICLIPFAGMPFAQAETSAENRTLAAFPSVYTEQEGFNVNFLSDAGDYFQDHFAFRNELVTANALLNGKLLGVSTASGVIQGTDNWLYYKDSLNDFQGTNLLSERSLFNIAHTLSMMQEGLQAKGVRFLFTVAPNKNSLYGENMPYYDSMKVTEENNLARLVPLLESEGVAYADLKSLFESQEEILYHERDSHWNNKGAALAADYLMELLEKEHDSYAHETYTEREDFIGDLDEMLYPAALTPETEIYYDRIQTFAYVGEVESNFDPRITTVNPVKSGSLVMYRDSFGNTLLPFLADTYSSAYFSRGVPYQLSDVDTMAADTVIVERAERFLPEMAENPPVMEAPLALPSGEENTVAEDGVPDVSMALQGTVYKISGWISPEYLDWDSEIYIRLNGEMLYEAFPADVEAGESLRDTGFVLYLGAEKIPAGEAGLEILVEKDGVLNNIASLTVSAQVPATS